MTWENQRRNVTLSRELGATLRVVLYGGRGKLARYAACILKTARILRSEKPDILFAQNPSMVLALFAVLYGKAFHIPVVVDAHNAGIIPFEGEKKWANRLAGFIHRQAIVTIVTNDGLSSHVAVAGGKPFVLPDPLPILKACDSGKLKGRHNVLFVCTYAADEPFREVIEAARTLKMGTCVYITGNPRNKLEHIPGGIPDNVVITGFLPEEQYIAMLANVDVVMVLTKRPDCLVCGAYEAVSIGKPIVLSDTAALRSYFRQGTVYTDNSVSNIGEKITEAVQNISTLAREIRMLRDELSDSWQLKRAAFEEFVENIVGAK